MKRKDATGKIAKSGAVPLILGWEEVIYIVGEVANSIMVFAYVLVTLSTRPGVGIPMDCIWAGMVYTCAVVL